ncbi:MAG TPA: hypothetical protein VGR48_09635 [Terriglobales bacterium]|nr:hypothetical protein [Terriglobales bacterium]
MAAGDLDAKSSPFLTIGGKARAMPQRLIRRPGEDAMNFCSVVPVQFSEWGWLFGFALASLALVALAVLADALYEGYRKRIDRASHPLPDAAADGDVPTAGRPEECGEPRKKAA